MMFKKIILPVIAISFSLFATLASAESPSLCQGFAGIWLPVADGQQFPEFNGIEVKWNPMNSVLSIEYNSESSDWSRHFTESYVVDSEKHIGDGHNTGSSYVASCDVSMIQITREGILKDPLLTTLTMRGSELSLWSGILGTNHPIEQRFNRR